MKKKFRPIASRLYRGDAKKREEVGWGPMAFIAPEFSGYIPPTHREMLSLMNKKDPMAYMIHVYDVLDLMAEAYQRGKESVT